MSYVKNKSKNNWISYNVRIGMIETNVLGDELDSATVILTQVDKLDIEPYDLLEVNYNGTTSYWLCADFSRTFIKKSGDALYDYTINLMSLTKLLETIILPSMSITAHSGKADRKISDYISRVFNRYAKPIFDAYGGASGISNNIASKFSDVCSECTFSQPTLREFLDYLMSFKGCISMLRWNNGIILDYLDLNPNNGNINTNYFDDITQSQGANDYVTELVTDANEIVANTPIRETLGTKNESGVYTSKNANIVTNYKLYDIQALQINKLRNSDFIYYINDGLRVYTYNSGTQEYTYQSDYSSANILLKSGNGASVLDTNAITLYIGNPNIIDYVVDIDVFNSLQQKSAGHFNNLYYLCKKDYYCKNNTLYWNRGNRTISNLNYYETNASFIKTSDIPAVENAYLCAFLRSGYNMAGKKHDGGLTFDDNVTMLKTIVSGGTTYYICIDTNYAVLDAGDGYYKYDEAQFIISYIPYANCKFGQRQDSYNHLISQVNNATNSLTDIKSFYAQAKEKNNQLGNPTITFTGHSPANEDAIKIGQKYVVANDGTYIVNKVEKSIQANSIQYKGTLTKNYSNRELQTILNREKRYYSLPSTASVVRKEVFYYTSSYFNTDTARFGVYVDNQFKCSIPAIRTILDDNTYCLTFEPQDNASIIDYVSNVSLYGADGKAINYYPYCDEYGETYNIKLVIFNGAYDSNYDTPPATPYLQIQLNNSFLKDGREKLVVSAIIKSS